MTIQTFEVDIPVSANQRLIRSKTGKALIASQRYRAWFKRAVLSLKMQRTRPTLSCRIGVSIVLHYPDNRRRDLDNSLKGLFDAMTHAGVWKDDSQIDCINVIRSSVAKPGYVSVRIKEIS